jgi:hypothetical protein
MNDPEYFPSDESLLAGLKKTQDAQDYIIKQIHDLQEANKQLHVRVILLEAAAKKPG